MKGLFVSSPLVFLILNLRLFVSLGWLQIQFANPTAISGYTLGVKGSCTWDMPRGWVFQGSSDGESWIDLDTRQDQIWDPTERKEFDIQACNTAAVDDCILGGYVHTEHWDCAGSDLDSIAVTASGEDDLVACALACARQRDCAGFRFSAHPCK